MGRDGRMARPERRVPTFVHPDGRFGHWRDKDMPMLDGLKRISTALGLLAATAAVTQAQAPGTKLNQATAEAVAGALRSSPNLSPYRIEIETQSGMADAHRHAGHAAQKAEAIDLARRVPGVAGVVDRLNVVTDSRVRPAQYQMAGGQPGFHRWPHRPRR